MSKLKINPAKEPMTTDLVNAPALPKSDLDMLGEYASPYA
jgi:hypothetical protein